jgi:hypothetical protein
MAKLVSNGWEIYLHPQLFGSQYQELFDRVSRDDCYEVFAKMVARGTFPDRLDELLAECEVILEEPD